MRLTLRTLLAYLDNVLEPTDANVLSEKIAKGRVARTLVDRIRRVSSLPKLSAPTIGAPGTANDPNPVAEYLDNTLKAEAIGAFEQTCLADDMRLAEIADCHRILTAVLSAPAIVPNSLRTRIMKLPGTTQDGNRGDHHGTDLTDIVEPVFKLPRTVEIGGKQIRVDGAHQKMSAPPVAMETETKRPIPAAGIEIDDTLGNRVPEYLRGGPSRDWTTPFMIGGLVVALLVVAGLSLGSIEDLKGLLSPTQDPLAAAIEPPDVAVPQPAEAKVELPVETVESISPSKQVEPFSGDGSLPEVETPPDQPLEDTKPANEINASSRSASPDSLDTPIVLPIAESNEPKETVASAPAEGLRWKPLTETSSRAIVLSVPNQPIDASKIRRLKPDEVLGLSESIIVPPTMRTEFLFRSKIRWTVADESILAMSNDADVETPAVELKLGRGMLEATQEGQSISIKTPQRVITLELNEAKSLVAIELRYLRRRGVRLDSNDNQLAESEAIIFADPVLRIFCVRGTARVSSEGHEPIEMDVAQGAEWYAAEPVRQWAIASMNEVPWWYENAAQRPIDAQAAETFLSMADELEAVDGMRLLISKCADHRLSEVAALGIRTQLLLGSYDRLFGSNGFLSNPSARPHRTIVLESLYQSVAARPDGPRLLRDSITQVDQARALRLLELASLPSDEQLASGIDRRFIEALGSPFVDERVLSLNQLAIIVGKENGYQPDRPTPESQLTWKKLLNSGKIRWSKSSLAR